MPSALAAGVRPPFCLPPCRAAHTGYWLRGHKGEQCPQKERLEREMTVMLPVAGSWLRHARPRHRRPR
jgi:hypothetical protein